MITPPFIIGFAGHRHLSPEQIPLIRSALREVFENLRQRAQTTASAASCELYTSIAYGADQLAVEVADAISMPVHLILPKPVLPPSGGKPDGFEADFHEQDNDQTAAWTFAKQRIDQATAGFGGGTCRNAPYTDSAPECYYDAGLQILNACDILVSVWNLKEGGGLGGTAQWVLQAEKLGLPVANIVPDTGEVRYSRMDSFAPAKKTDKAEDVEIVERISAAAAAETVPPLKTGEVESPAQNLFRRLDQAATRLGKEFRNHLVRSILLHGAATTVAAIAAIITSKESPWKVVLIGLAAIESGILLWLMWRNHRVHDSHVHETWIETRFAAELLRSHLAAGDILDPLHPLVANHHHPEWRRFSLAAGLMVHREVPHDLSWEGRRTRYVQDRLRHPDPMRGQIKHYRSQQAVAERRFHRFMYWGQFFTRFATYFVIGALLVKIYKAAGHHPELSFEMMILIAICFTLFPIILPLAGGVFLSLRSALDTGRRKYRYHQLAERLTTAAAAISELKTEAATRRAVAFTEDMLLDELIEWRLAEQQNGGH